MWWAWPKIQVTDWLVRIWCDKQSHVVQVTSLADGESPGDTEMESGMCVQLMVNRHLFPKKPGMVRNPTEGNLPDLEDMGPDMEEDIKTQNLNSDNTGNVRFGSY